MKVCLACEARFGGPGWTCPECGFAPPGDGFLDFTAHLGATNFPEESFELLARLEPGNFWFEARNDLVAWALETYLPAARSLFEIGCGTGFVLAGLHACFPELELAAGELSFAGLAVARSRLPDAALYRVDACRIPFEAEFDVVAVFDVLEHLDDDERALAEMVRAAKPGGGVLVSVPQHPRLWSAVDDFGGHRRRYTRAGLVRTLEAAGLEVLRTTSFVSLLLPAVALSRLRDRRKEAAAYDPETEFRIPGAVNRAFLATMRLERALIGRGVSFPAGSSLLAVARRRAD